MGESEKRVHLALAVADYDHVRDLRAGRVAAEGVTLTCLDLPVEEIFFRFTRFREWDASELSLAKFCALRARGDESLVGLPVFTSRSFRHSAFYVRPDGPVDDPSALRGARVGVPEWTVTATVYGRALLQHEYGIGLDEVRWVQGGTNEPGRTETLPVELPAGVTLERERERSLTELLLAGELDAILAPHAPAAFGDGSVVRLFSDAAAVEEDYFRRTRIFPIMHLVALRADVHERHPWLAMNLLAAFEEAKRRSQVRVRDTNAPRFPVPWGPAAAERADALFGADPWPYGLEPNRTTLAAFLGYAAEQGVCARRLEVEELFPPELLERYRV